MTASKASPPPPECRAVIDVGTNSVKLLVAHVHQGSAQPVLECGTQTRLGAGLFHSGRLDPAAIDRFYTEAGVNNLPVLRDPKSELARAMGVLGLPVTVIVNPEGQEVARLIGDAEWDSPEAVALLTALSASH